MYQHEHMTITGDPLVEFIALQSGLADALLREHQNDGTGHCTVCSAGGQTWRYVWPCWTAIAAKVADRRVEGSTLRDRR